MSYMEFPMANNATQMPKWLAEKNDREGKCGSFLHEM